MDIIKYLKWFYNCHMKHLLKKNLILYHTFTWKFELPSLSLHDIFA